MKKTLLFAFFLITLNVHSQVAINSCDNGNDGSESVDLTTSYSTLIAMSGQSDGSDVYYYPTQIDAVAETNPIANPSAYTTGSTTIFATVDGASAIYVITVAVNPIPPIPVTADVTACDGYNLPVLPMGQYYYTAPNGGGTLIAAGTTITATQTIHVWASNGNCSSESSFMVTIAGTPSIPPMANVMVCEGYVLPMLGLGNYYSQAGGTGNPITPGTVITTSQIVYVYAGTAGMCSAEQSFVVTVNPSPAPQLADGYLCNGLSPGSYLLDTGLPNALLFQWSRNGTLIPGATGNTFTATQAGSYSVTAFSPTTPSCSGTASAQVYDSAIEFIEIVIDDQTLTVTGGEPSFTYALDDSALVSGNAFQNIPLGGHVLQVADLCGNIYTLAFTIVTPSEPFGPPIQIFSPGQTLADVVVSGQNIQWYANDSTSGRLAVETPLPLTTVLVNGTTYYASQTINGIESPDRFAVLVNVGLGVDNNVFQNLSYYPNPVQHTFQISNGQNLDNIRVFNVLGQSVLDKKVNDIHAEVDLSRLNSGIYFVKIVSGKQQKTFRVVKE